MVLTIKKLNYKSYFVFCWALIAFFTIDPYITWNTYKFHTLFSLVYDIFRIIMLLLICFYFISKQNKHIMQKQIIAVILFMISYIYRMVDTADGSISISAGVISTAIFCTTFMLLDDDYKADAFNFFLTVFAITLIPGILVCICSLVHISLPYEIIQSTEAIKVASNLHYKKYFLSVILENPWWPAGYRKLCGMYDEAGRVGTIAGMLLPVLPMKSKSKKDRVVIIIIIIAGLMTCSLTFYVFLGLFVLLKLVEEKKITIKKMVTICAGTIILLYLATTNEYFQTQVIRRFNLEAIVINNNRISDAFEYIYNEFIVSKNFWFGMGSGNAVIGTVDAAGYQIIIYCFGIIGFLLVVAWLLYTGIAFCERKKKAIYLFVFFILSFYQRGWIFPFYHILILYGGIAFSKRDE